MGRSAALTLALLALATPLLGGCGAEEKKMSKEQAKEMMFKGTDVNSLPPEVRAKLPNLGDGSAMGKPLGTPEKR